MPEEAATVTEDTAYDMPQTGTALDTAPNEEVARRRRDRTLPTCRHRLAIANWDSVSRSLWRNICTTSTSVDDIAGGHVHEPLYPRPQHA